MMLPKENKDYSADKLSKMIDVNTEADSQILNVGVRSKSEKESEKSQMMWLKCLVKMCQIS